MKKIITLLTICIIICIVFASCKSNSSIVKRHYNNGYYIAHSKGKLSVKQHQDEVKITQLKVRKPLYSVKNSDQMSGKMALVETNPVASNQVVTNYGKIAESKSVSKLKVTKAENHKILSLRPFVTPITRTLPQVKRAVAISGDGGGLSLFWVIILILLILWALGFIGGYVFGGLIHLVLVVALILLILWLLHII